MNESKLQSEIISWLKINGVYVIKTKPGPGTPIGCPDIIGLYKGKWLAIEVKSDGKAKFQPGQRETLQRLNDLGGTVYVIYPEVWAAVKALLVAEFFEVKAPQFP